MQGGGSFGRRDLLKGTLAIGGLAGLGGYAGRPAWAGAAGLERPALVPMRLDMANVIDIKCCLRPFRVAGPNLGTEQIGRTLVVHNYGHGGSGWSLSWGSAEIAVGKALSVLPGEIAVIGCGVIGLTAAVHAQRAGLKVTIYAREVFQRTRSVRAGGLWSPDSRIALREPAGPAFGPLWEQMARTSWKSFRSYIGLPGAPVEFSDQYMLSDTPFRPREDMLDPAGALFATTGVPQQSAEFGHYADRIRHIVPQAMDLAPSDNPFGTAYGRVAPTMIFNFGAYGHLLMQQFLEAGGRFEQRDFHSPADIAQLREKVVINSTGFAAKALWNDRLMFPVRGQIGWLAPQADVKYGVRYRNGLATAKSDGVLVMNNPQPSMGEMYGVNDGNEVPDRADLEAGIAALAPLFAKRPTSTGVAA
ncbi:FAD-dependent oxidoreductase [Rhizorhabdus sp. FW153]|uniref:FAD-dependent oxidoreductase n=1 Tax=Rhizorhabdus sp. FW153 TaxID=3400216 RepID=UPI003CEC862F